VLAQAVRATCVHAVSAIPRNGRLELVAQVANGERAAQVVNDERAAQAAGAALASGGIVGPGEMETLLHKHKDSDRLGLKTCASERNGIPST
jgi:hypothetical protein